MFYNMVVYGRTYNAYVQLNSATKQELNQNAYGRSNKKALIHPGHTLRNQELVQSLISIEPAPATILHTAMRKSRLIMDRHAINMNRPAIKSAQQIHQTHRIHPDENQKGFWVWNTRQHTQIECAWPSPSLFADPR